jgi:hypothetical protein
LSNPVLQQITQKPLQSTKYGNKKYQHNFKNYSAPGSGFRVFDFDFLSVNRKSPTGKEYSAAEHFLHPARNYSYRRAGQPAKPG